MSEVKQHEVIAQANGDLIYTGGWVIGRTNRFYVADMAFTSDAMTSKVFLGGSGRNVRLSAAPNTLVPAGYFTARTATTFGGVNYPDVLVTLNTDGSATVADATDVIASVGAGGTDTTDVPSGSFPLPSTPYGETLGGAGPFTLQVWREAPAVPFQPAFSIVAAGTFPLDTWTATDADHYTSDTDGWTLVIAGDGSATINDGTDDVAVRPAGGPLHDPTGQYEATAYGQLTYNDELPVSLGIALANGTTLEGYVYLIVTESSPQVVSGVTGPAFALALPTAEAGTVVLPIAWSDGAGNVEPLWEGPLFWGTATETLSIPVVTISYADYLTLIGGSGYVAGTLYAIPV